MSEEKSEAHELSITRHIDVTPEVLWRCWTEPALMKQWFTPAPWKTVEVDLELRPGGISHVVMESPEGERFPNPGVVLEVEPCRKLVMTDAFVEGWQPKGPFMVSIITFEPEGSGTRYTATVRHWTREAFEKHKEMGFEAGWGKATDQLEALAKSL